MSAAVQKVGQALARELWTEHGDEKEAGPKQGDVCPCLSHNNLIISHLVCTSCRHGRKDCISRI